MSPKSTTSSPPNRDSPLSLREITESNWRLVANLRVHSAQSGNLADNPMSMLEAHYSEDAWMRAVYTGSREDSNDNDDKNNDNDSGSGGETLVGFLMMALWPPTEGYYIWRLMIDHRYQGLGFGRRVVGMAIEHVRKTYPEAKRVGVMSTPREGKPGKVEAEHSPYEFYVKLGFRQTEGPDEDGEVMMEIEL